MSRSKGRYVPTPEQERLAAERKAAREAKEAAEKEAKAEAERLYLADLRVIRKAFSQVDLKRVCEAHESTFGDTYGMERVEVDQTGPENYYFYKDNGSNILAVAHLDTVVHEARRHTSFARTTDGLVVHSGALDDRLGAYIITELLPKLDLTFDWLLTVGEESGKSTAKFFTPPEGKDYLWGIEFDRGNMDVVMYCYDDFDTKALVRDCGARPGSGSFSDIAYLEHLEIKMFNWGVAYKDYHGPRGYAYLEDTFEMLVYFLTFHRQNEDNYLPHEKKKVYARQVGNHWGGGYDSPYGYWEGGSWHAYTEEEKAERRRNGNHWSKPGKGAAEKEGGTSKALVKTDDEVARDDDVDEWWRTRRDSLYGGEHNYELYDPARNLGGHEEIDEETKAILAQWESEMERDTPFDIDPENPLGLTTPYDQDPDFVGPMPDETHRVASSEIGGWPTGD